MAPRATPRAKRRGENRFIRVLLFVVVVELAAVAGAAETGGLSRNQSDLAAARPLGPPLVREEGPVRLGRAADVRAAARHDREARQVSDEAVVAHVGRTLGDLAGL